jgi:formylglycine-generating enzyme required for sulfatase activity
VIAGGLLVPACGGNPSPAATTDGAATLPTAEEARVTAFLPFGGVGAWAGTFDGTLVLLGAATVAVEPPEDPAWGSVRALTADDRGRLVVAAGSGLFRWSGAGWESLGPAGGGAVPTTLATGGGAVWAGWADPSTGRGSLARVGAEAWALPDEVTAIASASMVNEVTVDVDGAVWVATNAAGVARRAADGSWSLHDLSTGALRSDWVLDIAADPVGGAWVATRRGVTRLNASGHEHAPQEILPGPLAVTADAVWVGNSEGCLARLDRATGVWQVVRPALPHMIAVTRIAVADDGTAWVGTDGGGLMRFAPDGTPLPGFADSDGHITALAASGDIVWAGTRGGRAYRLTGSATGVDAEIFQVVPAVGPSPAALDERVEIPAGWFLMGSDSDRPDEAPQRRVYLDAFYIDRYEVTNRRYDDFATATGLAGAASWPGLDPMLGRGDFPVAGLRWEEAAAYCAWVGGRLPTEAEWEKAARGTDGRTWPWGDEWDPARANTAESGAGGPMHVGSFASGVSPYQLADMAGNLEEWVADYYQADYYRTAPDHNPRGPSTVVNHVRRGGSWAGDGDQARTSYRTSSHGSSPDLRAGFRCAWDAQEVRE